MPISLGIVPNATNLRLNSKERELACPHKLNNFYVEQVITVTGLTAKEIKALMN